MGLMQKSQAYDSAICQVTETRLVAAGIVTGLIILTCIFPKIAVTTMVVFPPIVMVLMVSVTVFRILDI